MPTVTFATEQAVTQAAQTYIREELGRTDVAITHLCIWADSATVDCRGTEPADIFGLGLVLNHKDFGRGWHVATELD